MIREETTLIKDRKVMKISEKTELTKRGEKCSKENYQSNSNISKSKL